MSDIIKGLTEARLPVYVIDSLPVSTGHATTEELLREVEVLRWRVAEAETEYGADSIEAEIVRLTVAGERKDIDRELHRRYVARSAPSAPRWPDVPDRTEELAEIKRRTDILELAERIFADTGIKRGPATWYPCFAHEDGTPSLAVYPETQHFHTYCCGMHGDCIDLARHALRLTSFQATMALLGEWSGVTNRVMTIQKGDDVIEVQR